MDQFNTWGDGESVIKSPQGIQSRKTNSWRFATTLVISLIFYVKWAAAAPWCNTPPPPSLGIIELGFWNPGISNSEKRLRNLKSLWKHGKLGSHPHYDPQSKSSTPGLKRPNPAQIQRQQTKKKNPNICATVFEGAMGRTTQEPRTYLQIWKLPWILGSNKSTQKQQILDWCVFFKNY
jgi:hypothetical protein